MRFLQVLIWVLAGLLVVEGDINMHNPRGSNDRQDENTNNRKNANRLFNSQNNDRGGHNVGPSPGEMYFYEGSQLRVQWANQHTCGDENTNCNVVMQYMCDENLRDGTTISTAPLTCIDDCDTNTKYGHHESLTYYEQCASRLRNVGLFTANQNLGDSAQHTRQNSGGTRYGYECQEERDYYPYFGPTPWKDIAVFTNNSTRCAMYKAESQNVKSKWACSLSDEYWDTVRGGLLNGSRKVDEVYLFNDKESCEQVSFVYDGVTYNAVWKEYPSHGISAPDCLNEPWSRDNHQGNTIGGEFLEYNWTIPSVEEESVCTLRIRYNISTNDFEPWHTDYTKNLEAAIDPWDNLGPEEIYINYNFSGEGNPRSNKKLEAFRRQYYLRNNPQLDVFDLRSRSKNFRLRIPLNTAQYGRTFQDRSHSFRILPRPDSIAGANIYNLNVRGKRGNLQQVYPSTEYDFVPNQLRVQQNDYVHIQWSGSDNNPINNAGQGQAKTDRHNIVQLGLRPYDEGNSGSLLTLGTNYPPGPCEQDLFGMSRDGLTELALGGDFEIGETPGETLDHGEPYFDYGPAQMLERGTFYYFSTRNNAFTNRDQKATIIVE